MDARARELFDALDANGDGVVTEDEFVEGCMSDEAFVKVLEEFTGEMLWGKGHAEWRSHNLAKDA